MAAAKVKSTSKAAPTPRKQPKALKTESNLSKSDTAEASKANIPSKTGPVPGPTVEHQAFTHKLISVLDPSPRNQLHQQVDPSPIEGEVPRGSSEHVLSAETVDAAIMNVSEELQLSPETVTALQRMPHLAHLRAGHFISRDDLYIYVDTIKRNDDEWVKDVAYAYAVSIRANKHGMEVIMSPVIVFPSDKPESEFHKTDPLRPVWRYIYRFTRQP